MNSFQFNKIAGAVLGTALFVQVLYLASSALFSHPAPPKPAESEAGAKPAAPAAAAPAELLATYIGAADAKKGEDDSKPCQICHNLAKGGGVILGPPLYGVVGRARASIAGFQYSDAMKAKGGTWTPQDIFTFIKDPQAFVPGTKMTFAGEPDPKKRANIVAYLDTLSDHPVPLPKPGSAPAAAAPAAAAATAPAATAAPAAASAAPAETLASYIGKADATRGQDDTKACQICHNFAKGGGAIVGPPLYGVVGRARASVAGFQYSDAMKAKGGTWTPQDIFTFIKDPQAFVPGTKMTFAGEPSPKKRADIVAYLDTLSDHPVPLPKPAGH